MHFFLKINKLELFKLQKAINYCKNRKEPFEDLCEVYLFYVNDIRGRVPLLIFPNDNIKIDSGKMRPINIHSIWHLRKQEKVRFEHIGLIYRNKIYLAKKMPLKSRIKTMYLFDCKELYTPRIIVVIVALPLNLIFFGGDLLDEISKNIILRYEFSLYKVIESELAESKKFQTPIIKDKIKKEQIIKKQIKKLIKKIIWQFFSNIIEYFDSNSMKKYYGC